MAAESRPRDLRALWSRFLNELFGRYRGRFLGSLCGFGLALMLFLVGFWWTLLFLLLTAAGFVIGRRYDEAEEGQPALWEVLDRLLPPDES